MKIKTKKVRLIVKSVVCIVLALAILIPATMLSLAENETTVSTTPKEMSSGTLEYYDLEKGVYTNKQVTGPNADETYNVTVDTYTSDVTYISGSTPPVDIMILLDNSASMITLNSTEDGLKSKRDMAKTAISNVLSDLVDKYHVGEANKIQTFISLYTFSNTCTDEISLRLEYRKLNNDTKKAILNKIDGIAGNAIGGTNTGEGFERMKEK